MVQTTTGLIDSSPEFTANVNVSELQSGRSFFTFYAFEYFDGFGLSTNLLHSKNVSSEDSASASTSTVEVISKDFDVSFNVPTLIEGECQCHCPWFFQITSGSSDSTSALLTFEFYHFDGSTETSIGSSSVDRGVSSSVSSAQYFLDTFFVSLSRKKFRKNDTLRLRVKVEMTKSLYSVGTFTAGFAHDPQDGSLWGLPTSQTVCRIPFDIQLH